MPETELTSTPIANRRGIRRLAVLLLIVALVIVFTTGVLSITQVWNLILLQPILNLLVLLSKYLLGNFGLAIIVLTILIRLITLPPTLRQLRAARAMRSFQPKIMELRKKYANDKSQLTRELMTLYRGQGSSYTGCLVPILIQLPLWIALYQAITQALAATNENLLGLSHNLYSLSTIQGALPLNERFIGLGLLRGNVIMAILVALSIWVLQKMASQPSVDSDQESMNRLTQVILPLLFGFMAITLPSGLSLYWAFSNAIGILIQYRIAGWGTLKMPSLPFLRGGTPEPAHNPSAKPEKTASTGNKGVEDVAAQQDGASLGGAGSDNKKTVGPRTISQRKKPRQ